MSRYGRSVRAGLLACALLSAPAVAADGESDPRFDLEFELGATWQNRNDVEIPNDGTATRFSLKDLVGTGPWAAPRVTFIWNVSPRHSARFLAAPLSYTETGQFDQPVLFAGAAYAAGVPTEATYQFNSWRASYRYKFKQGERWNWWIGLIGKVRDAKIELSQGNTTSRDTDLGFVPLIYLRGDWRFAGRWHAVLELEALGGGPGRAEDLSLRFSRDVGERWAVNFGYRTVEGGADVTEVYNFAWFNYAVASANYRWGGR